MAIVYFFCKRWRTQLKRLKATKLLRAKGTAHDCALGHLVGFGPKTDPIVHIWEGLAGDDPVRCNATIALRGAFAIEFGRLLRPIGVRHSEEVSTTIRVNFVA